MVKDRDLLEGKKVKRLEAICVRQEDGCSAALMTTKSSILCQRVGHRATTASWIFQH